MLPKILYVDDEPINLQVFALSFRKSFEVLTAKDGLEGLEKLQQNRDIQVVISDMKMPIMLGTEFLRKAHAQFPDKQYYILTGYDFSDEIQALKKEKIIINQFQKPFNFKLIKSNLEAA